uniref:Uncharacterized protein n=1 Tax=Helianthus annuus TaxID=4232 RepID=A0A251VBU2_HELAN
MSTANPSSTTISNALSCCSAYIGHAAVGTPNHRLSSIEFHPQWDTNPPTASCASNDTCGAHPITFPILEALRCAPGTHLATPLVGHHNRQGALGMIARVEAVGVVTTQIDDHFVPNHVLSPSLGPRQNHPYSQNITTLPRMAVDYPTN